MSASDDEMIPPEPSGQFFAESDDEEDEIMEVEAPKPPSSPLLSHSEPLFLDGGDDDETSRHTRLLAYDVSGVSTADGTGNASYVGEWVVQLPVSGNKGKTRKASEIHFVSNGTFLVLCRDGKGAGDDDSKAKYKYVSSLLDPLVLPLISCVALRRLTLLVMSGISGCSHSRVRQISATRRLMILRMR